jgi:hypothetical protein
MTVSSITDDDTEDGRWLTYTELARERGISRTSAVRLVRRQRWRRQMGNDGEARVYVLSEHLTGGEPPVTTPVTATAADRVAGAAFETALTAIEAAHASEVAALRERADTAEQGRLAAQALADAALANLADMGSRVERADAAAAEERRRADALRERLEGAERDLAAAQHDVQAAQDVAAELRLAEEARQARGRLRRAWDGWRGR